MRARDGTCGSSDVVAVIGASLFTVCELVNCDLVDIARASGIAANRRIVVEHAIDHSPGIGLVHGIGGTGDGRNAIIGVTALKRAGQTGEKRRGLTLLVQSDRSSSPGSSLLLLNGNRGGLELVVGPTKLSGSAHGIGLKQAAIVLRTILRDTQRGGIDTHAGHCAHGKGNSTRDDRLVD